MHARYTKAHPMSRIKTKFKVTETAIQQAYFAWVRLHPNPKLRWVHSIPNGARRSITSAQRAKAEGLLSGIADVFIPYPTTLYHGRYLEFKTPTGKQSPNQQAFAEWCYQVGYGYDVVRSVDEAIKLTCEHLEI